MRLLALLLLVQLQANQQYVTETIDNLSKGTTPYVRVQGTVAAVSLGDQNAITFRIGDEHGHFVNCEYAPGKGKQPRLGVKVWVYGARSRTVIHRPNVNSDGLMPQTIVEIKPVDLVRDE